MPYKDGSSGSKPPSVTELSKLLEHGDFEPGRRDSQVNIVLGPERRSTSLRPPNGKRYWAVVGALVAGILALAAAIWKLVELLAVFN